MEQSRNDNGGEGRIKKSDEELVSRPYAIASEMEYLEHMNHTKWDADQGNSKEDEITTERQESDHRAPRQAPDQQQGENQMHGNGCQQMEHH